MEYRNIYQSLRDLVLDAVTSQFQVNEEDLHNVAIEIPKDVNNGDLSTNAAMIVAGKLKLNPRQVADKIISRIKDQPFFKYIEVAGPGFINFSFNTNFWHNVLVTIISSLDSYGKSDIGKGEKVNIEFVSANPTGPMHIGHARGAVYGDVLARIMENLGFNVTREYYVNDAGGQIEVLSKSAYLRYQEAFGKKIAIPEGYYPGEYLIHAANEIKKNYGDKFLNNQNNDEFKELVIQKMIQMIKKDLLDLQVKHDLFFSEKTLYENAKDSVVAKAIDKLKSKNLLYEGKLPAPKGEIDPDWEDRDQLLFKSTQFGDDQDRSITKSDGSYTYFAGDISYAYSKIERGFNRNIIVLGADHVGYIKRLKSVYNALSDDNAYVDVPVCQIVNFVQDGKPIKMSKRAGSFTTVADVIKEVGSDIIRFIMLTRKNDIILDFDLDLVKSQTKENPIFYVQYAQVRALSVARNAKENFERIYNKFNTKKYDLMKLNSKIEIDLIRDLSLFPKILSGAGYTGEIHKLPYYLIDLASAFHSFWNYGKENAEFKFITESDEELSAARLALVSTIAEVIRNGLKIMGIKPLDRM